jgi:osmotically-inducible protein OsmY
MLTSTPRRLTAPAKRRIVRNDRTVQEQLEQQFRATPYRELVRVVCRFQRGTVTLDGEVSSYYLKQIAQTLAKHVHGVTRVVNRVGVRPCGPVNGRPRRMIPCDWID